MSIKCRPKGLHCETLTFSEFRSELERNARFRKRWKSQWTREQGIPGYTTLGCKYRHCTGIEVQHCGHPTALRPWYAYLPDGARVIHGDFYAFRHLEDCRVAAFVLWWNQLCQQQQQNRKPRPKPQA